MEQKQYHGIFDSHAHYNDEAFEPDRDELIHQIHGNGVCAVINVGCDLPSSRDGIALSRKYPFFYASVGIHPHDAQSLTKETMAELRSLAQTPKVVAVGEIGLDYHYDFSPREKQREAFEQQLILAKELSLPVIIHSREATEEALSLLKKYRPQGVVHCFSGSAETAREIANLGMYLGFTGMITFKNTKHALEAIKALPADRLLLETDCPYMTPVPYRGKRCDSSMIAFTAQKMAELKSLPVQEMIDIARQNTCRLFGIEEESLK